MSQFINITIGLSLVSLNNLTFGASAIYSGAFLPNTGFGFPTEMSIIGNTIDPTVGIRTPLINSGMQVSVDPQALKISFDELRFRTASVTTLYTTSRTVGFGAAKNYNISVTIDPINWSFFAGSTLYDLQAGTAGNFDILNSLAGGSGLASTGSALRVAGSYTIAGPTEMVSGTFDTAVAGNRTVFLPNLLETANFPADITATRFGGGNYRLFMSSSAPNVISRVVDGATIDWDFDYVTFQIPERTVLSPGSLSPIPEVTTPIMSAIGLMFLLIAGRRRK